MMKVTENHTEKEIWDAICTLSDIRAGCNLFDPNDVKSMKRVLWAFWL